MANLYDIFRPAFFQNSCDNDRKGVQLHLNVFLTTQGILPPYKCYEILKVSVQAAENADKLLRDFLNIC